MLKRENNSGENSTGSIFGEHTDLVTYLVQIMYSTNSLQINIKLDTYFRAQILGLRDQFISPGKSLN